MVDVEAGSSGWGAWGIGAGVLLIGLLLVEARLLSSEPRSSPRRNGLLPLFLGAGILGLTIGEFSNDSVSVHVGSMARVETTGSLWPAHLGLALASAVAVTALVAFVAGTLAPRIASEGAVPPGHRIA